MLMEIDTPDWPLAFLRISESPYVKSSKDDAHVVIPNLDDPRMQGSDDPGPGWVEADPLHSRRVCIKFF